MVMLPLVETASELAGTQTLKLPEYPLPPAEMGTAFPLNV